MAAVLVSLGRYDSCPEVNVAEFFNTIGPKQTLIISLGLNGSKHACKLAIFSPALWFDSFMIGPTHRPSTCGWPAGLATCRDVS
jgi:hypothetical protein